MGPFGISSRTNSRQGTYANQIQGRIGGYHRGLNSLTRLTSSYSSFGGGGFSTGSAASGSGSYTGSRNNVPRNVPRPLQTSSLKKENGGQDVTAVLVNRRNGSGKKVGWGSALPTPTSTTQPSPAATVSSEPTPAETVESQKANQSQTDVQQNSSLRQESHHSVPTEPNPSNRNIPWALHPPTYHPSNSPPVLGTYDNSYPSEPYSRSHGKPHIENHGYSEYDNSDNRFKNSRRNYRDQNSSHMLRSSRPYEHGSSEYYDSYNRYHYDSFRREINEFPRDRGNRPFARKPMDLNRSQNHESYSREYYRDYGDYRENRGASGYRSRMDSYSNKYLDYKDGRGSSFDREDYKRFSGRSEHIHDHEREYNRRNVFIKQGSHHYDPKASTSELRGSTRDDLMNRSENENKREENSVQNNQLQHSPRIEDAPIQSSNESKNVLSDFHQPPAKSEEDIIMQTIRDREAAEARALAKKEMQTTGDSNKDIHSQSNIGDKGVEMERISCESENNEKSTLLDNSNQQSGEASGNDCKSDQGRIDSIPSEEDSLEQGENFENELNDKAHDLTGTNGTLNNMQTISIDKKGSQNEAIDIKKNNMKKDVGNAPEAEVERHEKTQSSKNEMVGAILSDSEKEFRRKNEAMKQQQKILRQVAAARKSSKKIKKSSGEPGNEVLDPSETDKSINLITNEERDPPTDESKMVEIRKQEKAAKEAEAKEARAEYSKSRGPRTSGVLFRRLPDGNLINADLSEEQIEKREARKLAKIKKIQAKMEKREKKRIQAKLKREKLKENEKSKEEIDQSITTEKNDSRKCTNVKKTFIPAPPPLVSAWKAGPPPGFKVSAKSFNDNNDIADEISVKNDLDQSLFPTGLEETIANDIAENSRITSYSTFTNSSTNWTAHGMNHNSSSKKMDSDPPFSSHASLDMSMSQGIASWDAFGTTQTSDVSLGIPSFGLGQSDITATSANWVVSQTYESTNATGSVNIWTHENIPPMPEDNSIFTHEVSHDESKTKLDEDKHAVKKKDLDSSNQKNGVKTKYKKTGRRNNKLRSHEKGITLEKTTPVKVEKKRLPKIKKPNKKKMFKTKHLLDHTQDPKLDEENHDVLPQDSKPITESKRRRHLRTNSKVGKRSEKVDSTSGKSDQASRTPRHSSWKKRANRPMRRQKVTPLQEEKKLATS